MYLIGVKTFLTFMSLYIIFNIFITKNNCFPSLNIIINKNIFSINYSMEKIMQADC